MSSKYKSPLIKPRNTPASSTPVNTPHNLESPSQQENAKSTENSFSEFDTTSERSFGSPKILNSSPKESMYQWRSPNTMNSSSNQSDSSSDTSQDASVCSEHSPNPNKFTKQDDFNNPKWNNKNDDEQFFHPSMLEDPWAELIRNQKNNSE